MTEVQHIPNLTWMYDADAHNFTMDVSYGFDGGIAWATDLVIRPDYFFPAVWTMSVEYREAPGYPNVEVAPLAAQWVKPANVKTDADIRDLMEFGLGYARTYQHQVDVEGYQTVVVIEQDDEVA